MKKLRLLRKEAMSVGAVFLMVGVVCVIMREKIAYEQTLIAVGLVFAAVGIAGAVIAAKFNDRNASTGLMLFSIIAALAGIGGLNVVLGDSEVNLSIGDAATLAFFAALWISLFVVAVTQVVTDIPFSVISKERKTLGVSIPLTVAVNFGVLTFLPKLI